MISKHYTKQIAILVNDLSQSQLSFYSIKRANEFVKNRPDRDVSIYYENLANTCVQACFAVLPIADAYSHPGTIVATSLTTASALIGFPSAGRKIFLNYDLFWLRFNPRIQYEVMANIYRNERLEIMARSESHAKIISNNFNVECKVWDFNLEEL